MLPSIMGRGSKRISIVEEEKMLEECGRARNVDKVSALSICHGPPAVSRAKRILKMIFFCIGLHSKERYP